MDRAGGSLRSHYLTREFRTLGESGVGSTGSLFDIVSESKNGGRSAELTVPRHPYRELHNKGEDLYLVGLTKAENIGPVMGRKLLERFGSARNIFCASKKELLQIHGIGAQTALSIIKGKALFEAEKELIQAQRDSVKVVSILDPAYPENLKMIYDAPLLIYKKGSLELNNCVHIAIVGTRMPSSYGQVVAEQFASFFVEQGCCVVSGLAYGIDGIVHRAALNGDGQTVAVLGHGFGTIYPRDHFREARSIIEKGALITEFGYSTLPDAKNFPMRNRIISGICQATIVIEAGEKGGALITARMAFEQNRQVFAIPGDLTRSQSRGSNILIRDHIAKIVLHPSEVLEDLGMSLTASNVRSLDKKRKIAELKASEQNVLRLLKSDPQDSDHISKVLGIALGKVKSLLIGLEVKGYVCQGRGGKYRFAV